MIEPRTLPIFLGEGEEQIQIGEMEVLPYRDSTEYVKFFADITVFPGERLTFARIATWGDIARIAHYQYPKE